MLDGAWGLGEAGAGKQHAVHGGPIVGLRISLESSPWRIGPAWAVLAGGLASGAAMGGGADLIRLVAAVVLGDAVWGALWQLSVSPRTVPSTDASLAFPPYAQHNAPLARFVRDMRSSVSAQGSNANLHALVASLLLTAVLSAMLGGAAIALSLAVVLLAGVTRSLWRDRERPATVSALVSLGLPWLLGVAVVSGNDVSLPVVRLPPALILGVAFTVLEWGINRARFSVAGNPWGLWLGQASVLAALIVLREPVLLAIVAGLLAAPCWWLARRAVDESGQKEILFRCGPWWLSTMLIAALAAGA